jgi:uncharacterized membrane protein YfcA|tara:strand:- start:740 stop:1162 length:423 start_codon:yes stop_codon:yes gene_type:complete
MIWLTVYLHPLIQTTTLILGLYVLKLGLKLRKNRLIASNNSRGVILQRHIRLARIFIILFTLGYLLGLIEMKFVLEKPIYNSFHSFLGTLTLICLYSTAYLGRLIRKRNNEKYRELHRFCAFIGIFLALTTGFAGIGLLP